MGAGDIKLRPIAAYPAAIGLIVSRPKASVAGRAAEDSALVLAPVPLRLRGQYLGLGHRCVKAAEGIRRPRQLGLMRQLHITRGANRHPRKDRSTQEDDERTQ